MSHVVLPVALAVTVLALGYPIFALQNTRPFPVQVSSGVLDGIVTHDNGAFTVVATSSFGNTFQVTFPAGTEAPAGGLVSLLLEPLTFPQEPGLAVSNAILP